MLDPTPIYLLIGLVINRMNHLSAVYIGSCNVLRIYSQFNEYIQNIVINYVSLLNIMTLSIYYNFGYT